MRVVAKPGDNRFLVSLEDDLDKVNVNARARGRVLDLTEARFYPAFNIHSLYQRGAWEPAELGADALDALIQRVESASTAPEKHLAAV